MRFWRLYDIFFVAKRRGFILIFFLFERYEQLLLSVFFFYIYISYINVKITRSKFKNNKNFTFFYPTQKKIRILKVKAVFSSLYIPQENMNSLHSGTKKSLRKFAQLFLAIF